MGSERRSAHQALEALWQGASASKGGWILEVDIRKFFDTLDHGRLREALGHRIRDGVVLRLIAKWLKAGVMEDGNISFPDAGSPQGGVISPLLANVYLHYVLDQWCVQEVSAWCRRHRHDPVGEQQQKLNQKLRGHYAYYGITGNVPSLQAFRELVKRSWRQWLSRRNRERTLTWTIMGRLLQRYQLAPARIVHRVVSRSEPST